MSDKGNGEVERKREEARARRAEFETYLRRARRRASMWAIGLLVVIGLAIYGAVVLLKALL